MNPDGREGREIYVHDMSSQDLSTQSSANPSRRGSLDATDLHPAKGKKGVRFKDGVKSADEPLRRQILDFEDRATTTGQIYGSTLFNGTRTRRGVPASCHDPFIMPYSQIDGSADIADSPARASLLGPDLGPPPIFPFSPSNSGLGDIGNGQDNMMDAMSEVDRREASQRTAQKKARRLSHSLLNYTPGSSARTPPASAPTSPRLCPVDDFSHGLIDVPMQNLEQRERYAIDDDDEDDVNTELDEEGERSSTHGVGRLARYARKLVQGHTSKSSNNAQNSDNSLFRVRAFDSSGLASGQITPTADRNHDLYVPRPKHYLEGLNSAVMKLYHQQRMGAAVGDYLAEPGIQSRPHSALSTSNTLVGEPSPQDIRPQFIEPMPSTCGNSTPEPKNFDWYKNTHHASGSSIASLLGSGNLLAGPGAAASAGKRPPPAPRSRSYGPMDALFGSRNKSKLHHTINIELHVEEIMARQRYIVKLCLSLMDYGAPTHRMEEYLISSSRGLEIEAQFLYIPGCMIISFDDQRMHTAEVKLVRTAQKVVLGKLVEMHDIMKKVMHHQIDVREASEQLESLSKKEDEYSKLTVVIMCGIASAAVGPFAFGARFIDMGPAAFLGGVLGFMQHVWAPKSHLYLSVFEILATILTSFLARAFGSLEGGRYFCFSALAQSSIALILPGYTVLCSALELQSRNIVAGSIRMVSAIIYSLFLGFGITIGTSFYGAIDYDASSETTCRDPISPHWAFLFVPVFTLCLVIINQGKWKQMYAMLPIAFVGFVVNRFSSLRFQKNAQMSNMLGALAVGIMSNLYSRVLHGNPAAVLIPAIFVLVPSGLAASGSLVSGIVSADQITNRNETGIGTTTVMNGTQAGMTGAFDVNSEVFNVGFSMVQVAVGITVGLFMSSILVYPMGKKRSGLFSF